EARPGDLAALYRAPDEVPLSGEVATVLRLSEVVPLLRQVGVELPATVATDERWETRVWATGTARHADRVGLELNGDQGSRIHAEGSAHGMDRWPQGTFDIKVDHLTMGRGMRQVIGAYWPTAVPLPSRLSLQGSAGGAAGVLHGALTLDSDLGRVAGSAMVQGWNGAMPDGLDLALTLTGLDVGRIIGDTALDPLSTSIIAKGERLNSPARSGSLNVTPGALTYAGNDFSSLRLQAEAEGDSVHVDIESKAEAADFQLNAKGRWPRTGDSLALDLDLVLRKLGFKDLGVSDHVLNAGGHITGQVAFSSDGFGTVRLDGEGVRLFNASREFRFERLALNGLLASDSTAVDLDSDALTVIYHSNMRADSLAPYARDRLKRYFEADSAYTPIPGNHAVFSVTLPRTEWLTDFVVPDLEVIELREFQGYYDSDRDEFKLAIDVPRLDHARVDVHELVLHVDAVGDRLSCALNVARAERDSLFVENLSVDAVNAEGGFDATLRVRHDERERYRIGASLRREDGVRVMRLNKDLVLNYGAWLANAGNALRFSDDGPRAENFELSSGTERVELRTGEQREEVAFTAFQLATITGLVNTMDSVPVISGVLDGTIGLPIADEGRLEGELTISDLRAKGVELGTLLIKAEEVGKDHYMAEAQLTHEVNRLNAKVDADLSGAMPRLKADADLGFDDLSFL
ncbi:MAG TPA: hypothetical protein VKG92_01020, partial [Flavobacteriales bacterium]|nr:hypothetical protein [Flavobacteriales bacterium]